MTNHDQHAIERIKELESLLEDAYVKIDILQESLLEAQEEARAAKGQLMILKTDRKAEVA